MMNRWISIHLEQLSSFIILVTSISSILFKNYFNPSLLSLALNYSINISGALNYTFRNYIESETGLVSVERIKEYSEIISEPERIKENDYLLNDWPYNGEIVFDNVFFKYDNDLPFVLKGISFKIQQNEKIGISKFYVNF
jgi:ATP-binding cassette subfamily C (CFTR/MRP) protein 1